MAVYLRLFHGRMTPHEDLNGWGFEGPIFGPIDSVHMTYLSTISIGEDPDDNLVIESEFGLIRYSGSLYGDMSISSDLNVEGGSTILQDQWRRTQEVLKTTVHDWPLMIHDPEPWVKNYARYMLAKEEDVSEKINALE